MTYLKAKATKVLIAAASVIMMASGAAAQDYTAQYGASVQSAPAQAYVKSAQLQYKAPQTAAAPISVKPQATRSKRRIIREALPNQRHSVRTVNIGRIFTTRDHSYDAMTIYKPQPNAKAAQMPNLFKPSR